MKSLVNRQRSEESLELFGLKKLAVAVVATTGFALSLLQIESVRAATIDFEATVLASDSTPLSGFRNINDGSGVATNISGFSSLVELPPSNLTFTFGDLELVDYILESGQTRTQMYAEGDGSPRFFELFREERLIANGTDLRLNIVTDLNPLSPTVGQATGFGEVRLTGVDGDLFFEEVKALTDGSEILRINVASFNATATMGTLQATGNFVAVPEPSSAFSSTLAVGGFLGAGLVLKRQLKSRNKPA